jgi:hypothetical protein
MSLLRIPIVSLLSLGNCRRAILVLLLLVWAAIISIILHRRIAMNDSDFDRQDRAAGLERRIRRIEFNNLPLRDAFRELGDKSGTAIVLDTPSLSGAGVDNDQEINLRIENATVRQIIEIILSQLTAHPLVVGYGAPSFGYDVESGSIRIAADVDLPHVVRMYWIDGEDPESPLPVSKVRADAFGFPVTFPIRRESTLAWLQRTGSEIDNGWKWPNGGYSGGISRYMFENPYRGHLMVVRTPQHHRQIRRMLSEIQTSRTMRPTGLLAPQLRLEGRGPYDPE